VDEGLNIAFDAQGWFSTGDIGVLDEQGYLTITDRLKDVIIRGGENISATEIEAMLARVDGIAEVAVVAMPDAKYGERACAFVRVKAGNVALDLQRIRTQLENFGLAKIKWPEALEIVNDFPRTPSGKIKKYVLRERLRAHPQD
jgi:acyl-CoA synthetase (AMP-forming)/AMP-acid ligase II